QEAKLVLPSSTLPLDLAHRTSRYAPRRAEHRADGERIVRHDEPRNRSPGHSSDRESREHKRWDEIADTSAVCHLPDDEHEEATEEPGDDHGSQDHSVAPRSKRHR